MRQRSFGSFSNAMPATVRPNPSNASPCQGINISCHTNLCFLNVRRYFNKAQRSDLVSNQRVCRIGVCAKHLRWRRIPVRKSRGILAHINHNRPGAPPSLLWSFPHFRSFGRTRRLWGSLSLLRTLKILWPAQLDDDSPFSRSRHVPVCSSSRTNDYVKILWCLSCNKMRKNHGESRRKPLIPHSLLWCPRPDSNGRPPG